MVKTLKVEALPGADVKANVIELEVKYSLGGWNYFTSKREARGYYLHASPLWYAGNFTCYSGFSGIKKLIKEVTRKSAKAEAEAIELSKEWEQTLIDWVCNKNGLKVVEE